MTPEIWEVVLVLTGAIILFVSDRVRMDLVALLALMALALLGLLEPSQVFVGFAEPIVLVIASLFILGEAIQQTGLAQRLGRLPLRFAGTSPTRLLVALMTLTAVLSSFMSSTGAVAIMIPVAIAAGRTNGMHPAHVLMPVAFASQLGGMLTLIGTPPNIIVSQTIAAATRPFGFLSFTPVGAVVLFVGIAFFATLGRRLLPRHVDVEGNATPITRLDLLQAYGLHDRLFRVRVKPRGGADGARLAELALPRTWNLAVVEILRQRTSAAGRTRMSNVTVDADTALEHDDLLCISGAHDDVSRACGVLGLVPLDDDGPDATNLSERAGIVEVVLPPRSRLIGQTIVAAHIRERFDLSVLGIRRMGKPITEALGSVTLRFGDTLLVSGGWDRIELLRREPRDFLVADDTSDLGRPTRAHLAPLVILALIAMIVLSTLQWVPLAVAAVCTALFLVLVGAVPVAEVYRTINWPSVVLIAALMPMGQALENTGALALAVQQLVHTLGGASPYLVLATLMLLTSGFSQMISNTATTVLLAPVALQLALQLDISPYPLLMGVAIAASTAFLTPMASPGNTMVAGPAGYRFLDFVRVGGPLAALVLLIALLWIPVVFPF